MFCFFYYYHLHILLDYRIARGAVDCILGVSLYLSSLVLNAS